MRRLILLVLCCVFCLAWTAIAFAQQEVEVDEKGGRKVPVEYSNKSDEQAIPGGGDHDGAMPMQALYTVPRDVPGPPNPQNAWLYDNDGEVDALANNGDAYFNDVLHNKVNLYVSFEGDPGSGAVWFETPAGTRGLKWTQANFNSPNGAGDLDDVDGLELWGPTGTYAPFDANLYSMETDVNWGTSIFRKSSVKDVVYLVSDTIIAAVKALGYTGPDASVDVDGLMVWDGGGFDFTWNNGDTIIFSIRPAGNWDGGEIVVKPRGGTPTFLNHGGHLWNTAFDVRTSFSVTSENVDGIEASPDSNPVPSLTEYGLIVLITLVILAAITVYYQKKRATAQ